MLSILTAVFFNYFKCYTMRYYVWAFYAKFSHQCFQPIPFGSVVTCSIFVGSRLNKSRKPGRSFSFSIGFLHVNLVIHQMVT